MLTKPKIHAKIHILKYYSKGRDMMRNCKLGITIALGCFLAAGQAKAFWPVFDFGEIPLGIITQIETAAENLSEMKAQISEMTENLRAIGDVRQTVAKFGKDLYNESGLDDLAETTATIVDKNFAANTVIQDKVIEAAKAVNDTHKTIINTVISQIEKETKIATKDISEYIKLAQNEKYIPLIEEDEEEIVDTDKEKKNLKNYFETIRKENLQLYVKLNDLFESSINVMNDGADLNHQALSALGEALKETDQKIDEIERKELQERTLNLLNKEQENSDFGIGLMENEQTKYSKLYQEKIVENLNNYQKMVQAYLEGNISAQELRDAGKNLKAEVDAINIFEDNSIFSQYNKENIDIQNSTNKLAEDVKRIGKDNS